MSFKRNQIEEALWHLFGQLDENEKPTRRFLTRVKRLLELDRTYQAETGDALAFQDEPAQGRGNEVAFTTVNAFCLSVALDLLDIGFKQSEIVQVLQYRRPKLEKGFAKILLHPPTVPKDFLARTRRATDMAVARQGAREDRGTFLLINRIEHRNEKSGETDGIFVEFFIETGLQNVNLRIRSMDADMRTFIILELSERATLLNAWLSQTIPAKRGRP